MSLARVLHTTLPPLLPRPLPPFCSFPLACRHSAAAFCMNIRLLLPGTDCAAWTLMIDPLPCPVCVLSKPPLGGAGARFSPSKLNPCTPLLMPLALSPCKQTSLPSSCPPPQRCPQLPIKASPLSHHRLVGGWWDLLSLGLPPAAAHLAQPPLPTFFYPTDTARRVATSHFSSALQLPLRGLHCRLSL